MFKMLVAAALLAGSVAAPASAVVLNIRVEATGGQLGDIVLDVTIDSAFDAAVFDSTAGLTINELSPPIDDPLVYTYLSVTDRILLGGSSSSLLASGDNDFNIEISDLLTSPTIASIRDSASSQSESFGSPSVTSLSVSEAAVVPLPASAVLLLSGLGVLALRRAV